MAQLQQQTLSDFPMMRWRMVITHEHSHRFSKNNVIYLCHLLSDVVIYIERLKNSDKSDGNLDFFYTVPTFHSSV